MQFRTKLGLVDIPNTEVLAAADAIRGPVASDQPLRERMVLAETAVTACHAAMLGKVHPKSPAWGLVYAVQDRKA